MRVGQAQRETVAGKHQIVIPLPAVPAARRAGGMTLLASVFHWRLLSGRDLLRRWLRGRHAGRPNLPVILVRLPSGSRQYHPSAGTSGIRR